MKPLFVETPLWESTSLSAALGTQVLLKMEAFQPSGSFKSRGMGAACLEAQAGGARQVVCSSGGNAGLAVAQAGRRLGMQVTIVVPENTSMRARSWIEREGAVLLVHGAAWDDAHILALDLAARTGSAYVHPFDDPAVWRGHSSIVREIASAGVQPGGLVVSVGGGGLLAGLLHGMDAAGWSDLPVLAVETEGADSFSQAMAAGKLVTLDAIRSIATTLGARTVCAEALRAAQAHAVTPWVVGDRAAVDACLAFAEDHRVLVEPACGAALAAVYGRAEPLLGKDPVVVIVCGGAAVSLSMLAAWDAEV